MFTNLAMFAYHVALSRSLGVDRYGVLYALVSAATFIAVIANILTVVIARVIAEARATAGSDLVSALVASALRRGTIAGFAAAALLLVLAFPLAGFLHLQTAGAVFALVFFTATQFVLAAARGVLQGLQRFFALAWSLVLEALIRTTLAIWIVSIGHGVTAAVAAYAVGSALAMGYTLWTTFRLTAPRSRATGLGSRAIARLSAGAAASTLAIAALGILDVVLVRHYFDNVTSSIYSAVSLAGKIVYLAAGFLPTVLLPKTTATLFEGRNPWKVLVPAAVTMFVMASVTLVMFALFPQPLIYLITGPRYAAASHYVFRYALAMTFLGATNAMVAFRIALSDFAFIPAAIAAVLIQAICIVIFHRTLDQVVAIVIATNAAAFAAVVAGLPQRLRSASGAVQMDPVLVAEELEGI